MGQFFTITISMLFLWTMMSSCAQNAKTATPQNPAPIEEKGPLSLDSMPIDTASIEMVYHSKDFTDSTSSYSQSKTFNYDLSRPSNTSVLPAELMEISALTYDVGKKVLYTVNDEKGDLYTLNPTDGKIIEKKKFGKKGDYEGVEISDEGIIYTVTANGNITAIEKSTGTTEKFKTKLKTLNDVEGLGYDANRKLLLLACKGAPTLSVSFQKTKKIKNVYGWSIENKTLIEEPILSIHDEALLEYLEQNEHSYSKSRMKKYKKRAKNFSPSGIAYQSDEALYYLISSVGKLLITADIDGKIHHIEFLDDTYFAQPEGICFGENNSLYISNEGRGLVPKLMRFDFLSE
ncbi:MAG: SdiA-regulated domain-containing protein [Saprospiraceae bacterium]|nr:SdiA-regulated domain-containing protein [Saprospiraceae bacterium]